MELSVQSGRHKFRMEHGPHFGPGIGGGVEPDRAISCA